MLLASCCCSSSCCCKLVIHTCSLSACLPHRTCRLAPLSEGRIEADGTLMCSYHGWQFNGQGGCTRIPQVRCACICATSTHHCFSSCRRQLLLGTCMAHASTGALSHPPVPTRPPRPRRTCSTHLHHRLPLHSCPAADWRPCEGSGSVRVTACVRCVLPHNRGGWPAVRLAGGRAPGGHAAVAGVTVAERCAVSHLSHTLHYCQSSLGYARVCCRRRRRLRPARHMPCRSLLAAQTCPGS